MFRAVTPTGPTPENSFFFGLFFLSFWAGVFLKTLGLA